VFLILPRNLLAQGQRIIQRLQKATAAALIVVLDAGEPDDISALLELGVADFIIPPLTALDILPRVRRLLEQTRERQTPLRALKAQFGLGQLIGESEAFRAVVKKIPRIAQCDTSVMISGETGTGKELCARAIHYLSPRSRQAFIPVNCGAIPTELVENELFGHERGAFTTAVSAQPGLIAEADGGALFLDEIDCLPLLAQVKFLRFLQEKEYRPLGSTKTRRADVRVIAAANVDCDEIVRAGRLRQDLYYRLNVIPLRLPPLRERRGDIPLLASHFLARYAAEFNQPALSLSADAMELLQRYEWPGNVRELEHLIARAVALAEREVIEGADLGLLQGAMVAPPSSFREAKARFERAYVEDLLLANHGNITRAAQAARKNRRAFWELIRKYHINVNSFKADSKSRSAAR
jgi:DNA-binding NtrC family response regulator